MTQRPGPTIRDVAALAGVSVATASNVLTRRRATSAASRDLVLAAAETLDYRPNLLATALRQRRSRLIGVVVPEVTNVFFSSLVHSLEGHASAAGYDIALVTSHEDPAQERARIEALVARQIDGLIVIPCADLSLADLTTGRPALRLPPLVVLDRGHGLPDYDGVAVDNAQAAHGATRHLLEAGHRDIAVLAPRLELANMRERVAGYERAMAEAGFADRRRLVIGGTTLEGLRAAIEQELAGAQRPSAVIAMSNVAALGAVKAIRALGLDMPADVSLVAFDDFDWMTVLRPYLTAVAQPIEAMAQAAWERLAARLADPGAGEAVKIAFPCTLHVRESTGPCRARKGAAAA